LHAIVPAAAVAEPELLHISPLHLHCLVVVAGVFEDFEEEDNEIGPEDDDAAFWGIVQAVANDACPICGRWSCTRAGCAGGALAPAPLVLVAPVAGDGQCSVCGGRFDNWDGGVCGACKSNGY